MFKDILIAYDGSGHAQKALNIAREIACEQAHPVVLRVVTVMDAPVWEVGEPYLSQSIEKHTLEGQDLLQEATELMSDDPERDGFDIHTELLFGPPADCILEVAETRGCDLIVIGTRGISPLEEFLLLGSQAQKVISHAHCPVLVVK